MITLRDFTRLYPGETTLESKQLTRMDSSPRSLGLLLGQSRLSSSSALSSVTIRHVLAHRHYIQRMFLRSLGCGLKPLTRRENIKHDSQTHSAQKSLLPVSIKPCRVKHAAAGARYVRKWYQLIYACRQDLQQVRKWRFKRGVEQKLQPRGLGQGLYGTKISIEQVTVIFLQQGL